MIILDVHGITKNSSRNPQQVRVKPEPLDEDEVLIIETTNNAISNNAAQDELGQTNLPLRKRKHLLAL